MRPERSAVLVTGAIAGLIGSAVVGLLFLILNLLRGLPVLSTAAALGSALFGIPATEVVPAAIAYNGVHVAVALVAGIGASFLMMEVEVHPVAWYAGFFAYVMALLVGFVVVGMLAVDVAGAANWIEVMTANVLAAGSMGWYLWKTHPGLRKAMTRPPD